MIYHVKRAWGSQKQNSDYLRGWVAGKDESIWSSRSTARQLRSEAEAQAALSLVEKEAARWPNGAAFEFSTEAL